MGRLRLRRGDIVLVEGRSELLVERGRVQISGASFPRGRKILVPISKSLPVEAEINSIIKYELHEGGSVRKLRKRTIPPDWEVVVDEIVKKRPRTVFVIGGVDVGKTFFTTYCGNILARKGNRVGVIDADVGQSEIGPPGTIGLAMIDRPITSLLDLPLKFSFSVGAISPAGHRRKFLRGLGELLKYARRMADIVLINNHGWISGGYANLLNIRAVKVIDPDMVVAIQRKDELEGLLANIRPKKIMRIPVSRYARKRSRKERARFREFILERVRTNKLLATGS